MERVQVEIYGQVYSIKGAGDPDHIRQLAAYVDTKMKDIEKGTGTVDPHRVAILAALTIAEELQHFRSQCSDLEITADNVLKRLLNLTEGVSKK